MREINRIIIHCSYTYANMDIGAAEIDAWHRKPPHNFRQIGYHYVILRDGSVEKGREEEEQGAHVRGHNEDSIGVCLIGGKPQFNFTWAQLLALRSLVSDLQGRYSSATLHGHNEYDLGKTCPTFDVQELFRG
jgi:N-acetylmuramoyl-L-alanine amidase